MARIVVPGINGELSGKLGGQVYARNRSGMYVRSNAIPVNPNTDAQIRARTAFGVASSQYHALTAAQKTAFQNFANVSFISKSEKAPGSLSGQNVFNSLRNTVLNMNELGFAPTSITVNSAAAAVTAEDFVTTNTAPGGMLMSGFLDLSNNLVAAEITALSVTGDVNGITQVDFTLNPNGVASPPSIDRSGGQLTDGSGENFGFAVYASNGMVQDGLFVANEEQYLIGAIKPFTFDLGAVDFTDLELSLVPQQASSKYQAFPVLDNNVRITIYQVSKEGMFRKIGAEVVEVNS